MFLKILPHELLIKVGAHLVEKNADRRPLLPIHPKSERCWRYLRQFLEPVNVRTGSGEKANCTFSIYF